MNIRVITMLACPCCRNEVIDLASFSQANDEVTDGVVFCRECAAVYPIEDGVLELLPPALQYQEDRRKFFLRWAIELRNIALPDGRDNVRRQLLSNPQQAIEQQQHFDWYAANDTQSYSEYAASPFWRAVDRLVFGRWKSLVSSTASGLRCVILDMGCAQGRSTFQLAGLGAQLLAFDISKHCIHLARARSFRERTTDQMTFICADAGSFPFRSSTFDYVLGYGVLHHFSDPARTCSEIARVLKPGGAYLGSENNHSVFRFLFDIMQKLWPVWHELAGPQALISAQMLNRWTEAAGLYLEARTHVFLPPHAVDLLSVRLALRVLGATDSALGALPFFRDNGGLLTFVARKPN